ncbi:MAG: OsmC family protein [Flavobacteriaceae bacterium]
MKRAAVKTVLSNTGYKAQSNARGQMIEMDRPIVDGGENTAPTPIEYLLAAIGGCVSMTIRVYANQVGWSLGEVTVNVFQKNKLTSKGLTTILIEEISFENEVTQEQKQQLLIVASECPVAKLLKGETQIQSEIV